MFGTAGPSAKLCSLVLSGPSRGDNWEPKPVPPYTGRSPHSGAMREFRGKNQVPQQQPKHIPACSVDLPPICSCWDFRQLQSPFWKFPDITSLKGDGICRQTQHLYHNKGEPDSHNQAKGFIRGKRGQEDKSILPRTPQVGRDQPVKWAYASEDSGLRWLSHAYFVPHWLNLGIKQLKLF